MTEIRLKAFIVMVIQLIAENWSSVSCSRARARSRSRVVIRQHRDALGEGQGRLLRR